MGLQPSSRLEEGNNLSLESIVERTVKDFPQIKSREIMNLISKISTDAQLMAAFQDFLQ